MTVARIFSLLFFLVSSAAFAQSKFTANGYIRDSISGESITAATITIDGKTISSNPYGFYSLTLAEGGYDVTVSHVSYISTSFHIELKENIERNIFLLPKSAALNEVIVYSKNGMLMCVRHKWEKLIFPSGRLKISRRFWVKWIF